MNRISRSTIDKIREDVKISDIFEWLGTSVVHHGQSSMAFCPFCEDFNSRTPGCSLDNTRGLFHCFVCGSGGDLFRAVQEHEECSFPEAVERIALQFNIPIEYEETQDSVEESRRRHLVSVLEAAQQEFLQQRNKPQYTQFLQERNIPEDIADKFELGMSLYTEADAVVKRLLESFTENDLIESGLCFKDDSNNSLVLRFKNRITFPIRTAPGSLVGFGGRDLTGKSPAKYKNSPETSLFKKRNILYGMDKAKRFISKNKKAIVCEGYMDTIALHAHGYPYSIGAMGTALTQYNLSKLASFTDTIYISLDSDQAGINAAMKTANTIPEGFSSEVKVLIIPEVECSTEEEVRTVSKAKAEEYLYSTDANGNKVPVNFPIMVPWAKDPDEFFNQCFHTKEEFDKIIEQSKDIFLFCAMMLTKDFIEQINRELSTDNPDLSLIAEKKMSAKRKVTNFLSQVYSKTNIYQRQNIANYMISKLRLIDTFEQLETEWKNYASKNKNNKYNNANVATNSNEQSPLKVNGTFTSSSTLDEDILIATLYFHPSTRNTIKENIEDISMAFTSKTRESLFNHINDAYGRGINIDKTETELSDEEKQELARIVASQKRNGNDDGKNLSEQDIIDICIKVQAHAIENMINAESNSASPDAIKIISLKTKLAKLRS